MDLYPLNYGHSETTHAHKFTYSLKDTPLGTYFYGDAYNKLGGKLVVESWPPWERHPGYAGGADGGGETRLAGARVPASRLNAENEITPASVSRVAVEVWLVGAGEKSISVALRSDATTSNVVRSTPCETRAVDGSKRRTETFVVDANSLPDGNLSFEIEVTNWFYGCFCDEIVF